MTDKAVSEELDRILTDHLDYYDDTVAHLRKRIIEAIAPRLRQEGARIMAHSLRDKLNALLREIENALSPPEPKP